MKYFFRKARISLVPADEKAHKKLNKLKSGEVYSVDIKQVRSFPQLKRFFKFRNIAFAAQDHFTEPEAFRRWMTIKAGYYTSIVYPDGSVVLDSDSIAFDSMDEEAFIKLFNSCINVFLEEFGSEISREELNTIIGF